MMHVHVSGAPLVRAALGGYGSRVQGRVNAALDASALRIEAGTKRAAPVDTGRLRASYRVWTPGPGRRAVGTDVVYAPYLEFGSRGRPPRPHLRPAFAAERPRLEAALRRALAEVVR